MNLSHRYIHINAAVKVNLTLPQSSADAVNLGSYVTLPVLLRLCACVSSYYCDKAGTDASYNQFRNAFKPQGAKSVPQHVRPSEECLILRVGWGAREMKATIGTGAVRYSPQLLAVLPITSCVRGFQKNSVHGADFGFLSSSSLAMVLVRSTRYDSRRMDK